MTQGVRNMTPAPELVSLRKPQYFQGKLRVVTDSVRKGSIKRN